MTAECVVSIVVPTKDRPELLARVIPSYLNQPELGELVIVDDGSGPETAAALERLCLEDPRIRVVRHPTNRGVPAAKNSGVAASVHPMVLFGEDDLELTPGYLGILLAHKDRTGADIISGRNVWRFDTESAESALARNPHKVITAVDRRRVAVNQNLELLDDAVEPLLPATMLAEREVFERVGFDERYRDSGWREESDFQLRAAASGLRLVGCPHAVSFNYMVDGDRGGAHGSIGLRRLYWQTRNNRLFVKSNAEILAADFTIGRPHVFMLKSLLGLIWREVVFPSALLSARAVRRSVGRSRRAPR